MAEPVRSQAAESRSIEEIARRVARGLHGKRGEEIVVLEVRDLLQIASYFVLATGSSARALQTLADGADRLLHESTLDRLGIEGTRGGRWICLDYTEVVVHLFDREARGFYDLDHLWADAPRVGWED